MPQAKNPSPYRRPSNCQPETLVSPVSASLPSPATTPLGWQPRSLACWGISRPALRLELTGLELTGLELSAVGGLTGVAGAHQALTAATADGKPVVGRARR